jgi:hypothetical protein
VSIQSQGQSDVVSVEATDPAPEVAARVANTFASSYIAFRRDADRREVRQALSLVEADFNRLPPAEQQGSEGQSLQRQISRLSTLEALQTGNAELVQHATVPTSPSSPKTLRNVILGWFAGLLFGLGLAAFLERYDRRLRMPLFDTDIPKSVESIDNPPPLLLVHDPDDPDSPYSTSERIVGVWPDAKLVTTRGLGRLAHYRILRHRPAIQAAVEFIG